jgi:hypothetical protein
MSCCTNALDSASPEPAFCSLKISYAPWRSNFSTSAFDKAAYKAEGKNGDNLKIAASLSIVLTSADPLSNPFSTAWSSPSFMELM